MAGLTPLTAAQWDAILASGYAAACKRSGIPVATLGEGSQLAAFFYAERNALMQQQTQLGYAVIISRIDNCSGADLDAALAAFNFPRLIATFSDGEVTCTTIAPITVQTIVPVGSQFETSSGLVFTVIADSSNTAYSAALGGYVMTPTGSSSPSSVSVTVQCTLAGSIGNVQPGQISIIRNGAIVPVGLASVTNPASFDAAINTETDAQYKARFRTKFAGGTDGDTVLAILAIVLGVQANLTVSVGDCMYTDGTEKDGWSTVVVNTLGATTATQQQLIDDATLAVDSIRTAGIRRSIIGSTTVVANFTAHLVLAAGADAVATPALAIAALQNYVNKIGLDPFGNPTTLSLAQVYRAIMGASPLILDVQNLQVNGGTVELTATFATQFVAGTIVFD